MSAAATFTPSTTPSSLTPSQRLARFVDEELVSFAFASTAYTGVVLAKEYFTADAAHAPGRPRLLQALKRTGSLLPAIVLSSAVGIAGMKLSIAAVSRAREDYTRSSVLLAFPVAGALLYMQRGPRAMAMAAASFGVMGYGADHLFGQYHRRNARLAEEAVAAVDSASTAHEVAHHHYQPFRLTEPFPTSAFLRESSQK
ncbi:hypothetical protein Gpo141_00009824 [Globisporangium polare]